MCTVTEYCQKELGVNGEAEWVKAASQAALMGI